MGPVDGVDYDQVVTEKLEPSPQSVVREVQRRPSGWVLQKLRGGRGPAGGALHAPDCEEAPQSAPLLDVEHALNVAENPATRLCNLCRRAAELTPLCCEARPRSGCSSPRPPWACPRRRRTVYGSGFGSGNASAGGRARAACGNSLSA
ncbi:DUF6233 domain-containing protein [Streptomyces sp. NPDC004227]